MFRKNRNSFVEKCARGEAMPEDVDAYVECWHRSSTNESIATFLGMNDEEYSQWLLDPDALVNIVSVRARNTTLNQTVRDESWKKHRSRQK